MSIKQQAPRAMLGLNPGVLSFGRDTARETAVPECDQRAMTNVFEQALRRFGLQCSGLILGFGDHIVLQIGDDEPFPLPIPSDLRSRAERLESALVEEFMGRLGTWPVSADESIA